MVVLGAVKVSCLESSEVEMRARVVLGAGKVSCLEVSSVQGNSYVVCLCLCLWRGVSADAVYTTHKRELQDSSAVSKYAD